MTFLSSFRCDCYKKNTVSDVESLSSLKDFLDARNMKFIELAQKKKKVLKVAECPKNKQKCKYKKCPSGFSYQATLCSF